MRVAMIGQNRIPSRESATDVAVEEIAKRVVDAGNDVVAYNRKGSHKAGYNNIGDTQKDDYIHDGITVKTAFTVKSKLLNTPVYAYFAAGKACKDNCSVVHIYGEAAAATAIKRLKKKGKRCIVTIDGLDWKRCRNNSIGAKICRYGERIAAELADEIIVLSEGDRQYFKEQYNRDVALVPYGVCEPVYNPPKVIKLKHALNGEDYILFLARIAPENGAHTLLEAYSKSGIEVPMVIAGSGDHNGEYYQTIKAFIDKFNDKASRARRKARIVLAGQVQGRELEELYSNAVMFVMPSEIEGMSVSLMEAMSYGNICLVSDIAENTSVVEQHGYCFSNDEVDGLRNSMRDIIGHLKEIREDPNMTKEAISEHILKKYNWDKTAKEIMTLYKSRKDKEEAS